MVKRRVVLRADASKTIGYGHFIRSIALAAYLKDDFNCVFASFNEDNWKGDMSEYQLGEINKICYPLLISGDNRQSFNSRFVRELNPDDIVVLDNYYYTTDYQQTIKDKGCKLVCIDDMHQHHMVCDLLFTVCPLVREDFSLEPYTKFAGGIEWAFLREPFLSPLKRRSVSHGINKIVMAMGGADTFNLTDKMIEIIRLVIPEAHVDVVCGETVTVTKQNYSNLKIHRSISAEEIVNLFDSADIGIFSASTICVEASSRKLPVIAGYYVDNQEEFYSYGIKHSYFSGLGNLLDNTSEIEKRLKTIIGSPLSIGVAVDFKSQKKKIIELFKAL